MISQLAFVLTTANASISEYFDQIKDSPNELYAFFKKMPKGGELHYHLSGGAYPETMLSLASNKDYCINLMNFQVHKTEGSCDGVTVNGLFNQPELYATVIKKWSLKDFIPGKESNQEHFFNSFLKFNAIVSDYKPQLIASVLNRAAQQNELYMEIMDNPDNFRSTEFGSLLNDKDSYEEKTSMLLANKDFQNTINSTMTTSDTNLKQAYEELGCSSNPNLKPCKVKAKIIYFVLRAQPLNDFFAQALNAFEATNRSKDSLIGVNIVQAEDSLIALRDYDQHMDIFNYLHKRYPKVHISLHAGELAPGSVTPEDLSFHIHDAIFIGQAQRIGHGVDISYETDANILADYMAEHKIPVEVTPISNLRLLNVSTINHPLTYYLRHKVPVVLSTDDEGILRTDLTSQYVEAVLRHGLNYQTIKQINRNALTYSFLPGKSIWDNAELAKLVPDCNDLNSKSCLQYIKHNQKATLQWKLEKQLISFETMK